MYSKTYFAAWSDLDLNHQVSNAAILEMTADARTMFFAGIGFPPSEFARLKVGPVVIREDIEVDHRQQIESLQEIAIDLFLVGLADDGSRFLVRGEVSRADGQVCAKVNSAGAWLNQARRVLVLPPADLLAALQAIPRANDFASLPSSVSEQR